MGDYVPRTLELTAKEKGVLRRALMRYAARATSASGVSADWQTESRIAVELLARLNAPPAFRAKHYPPSTESFTGFTVESMPVMPAVPK